MISDKLTVKNCLRILKRSIWEKYTNILVNFHSEFFNLEFFAKIYFSGFNSSLFSLNSKISVFIGVGEGPQVNSEEFLPSFEFEVNL